MKGKIIGLLFCGIFAAAGIGIFSFFGMPMITNSIAAKSWISIPAYLESHNLKVNHGDDSTTYQATARYRYQVNGVFYTSDRVGWSRGSDNVGNYQRDMNQRLSRIANGGGDFSVWVNPDDPSQAVIDRDLRWGSLLFSLMFLVIFGGFGLGGIYAVIRFWNAGEPLPDANPEQPWTEYPEWTNSVRLSNSKTGNKVLFGFALFWNLMSFGALFGAITAVRDGEYLALIVLLFPAVGIFLLSHWYKQHKSFKRTGLMPLTMNPFPGSIGGDFGGTIDISNRSAGIPSDSEVELQCVRSYRSGDKNREDIVWQRRMVPHWQQSDQGVRASFCFNVDEGLPVSTPPLESTGIAWRLLLNATLPDEQSLTRQYDDLPMFNVVAKSSIPAGEAHFATSSANSEKHQNLVASLLPIEPDGSGVRLVFPAYKSWGGLLFAIIGIVFAVIGVVVPDTIITIAFCFFGVLFAVIGLAMFGTGLKVRLGPEGITSQKSMFGFARQEKMVPGFSFDRFQEKKTHSSTTGNRTTQYYDLYAHGKHGEKVPVAINLKDDEQVRAAKERLTQVVQG